MADYLQSPFDNKAGKPPKPNTGDPAGPHASDIVATLEGYRQEAEMARKGGDNPRDDKWKENLDLYWGRMDFSGKAAWQAKEVLPEVSTFVDRFSASLKEALVSSPDGFYTVIDPADKEGDIAQAVKKMTDIWLSTSGRNQSGHLIGFPAVFEEQVKLGALMAAAAVVTWKNDVPGGRVAIDSVDPRFIWLDHTYRNLYRIRRLEIDRHELTTLAKMKDGKGRPIFNLPGIEELVGSIEMEDARTKMELAGHGQEIVSPRQTITLDEYVATVLKPDGEVMYDRALCVVANKRFLIRGPEPIPFWHGKDWLLYTPLVTTPLSVYGRAYMEDLGSVAKVFNELTNMILDAVQTSSLKVFAVVPSMLINPTQVLTGISPNKLFLLEDGVDPRMFMQDVDLGTLPPEAVRIWEGMKNELREGFGINEIGLGQFAPKSRTSATEITETKASSAALIRSLAETLETRHLDPMLDLVWKTGLQNAKRDNPIMQRALGPAMYEALIDRRRDLIEHTYTFQARGISTLIQKGQVLKALLNILQVIASSEILLAEFMREVDPNRLLKVIFELSNVDLSKLQTTEREQLIRQVVEPMQQAAQRTAGVTQRPGPAGQQQVRSVVDAMGVGREGNA